jgi:hypothetical protein
MGLALKKNVLRQDIPPKVFAEIIPDIPAEAAVAITTASSHAIVV